MDDVTRQFVDSITTDQLLMIEERYPHARQEILRFVEQARGYLVDYGPPLSAALVSIEHLNAIEEAGIHPEVFAGIIGVAIVELAQREADL